MTPASANPNFRSASRRETPSASDFENSSNCLSIGFSFGSGRDAMRRNVILLIHNVRLLRPGGEPHYRGPMSLAIMHRFQGFGMKPVGATSDNPTCSSYL